MGRATTFFAMLIVGLAATTAAQAESDQSVSFRYNKSELATAAGTEKVRNRIHAYAQAQCRTLAAPAINNPRAERCTRELAERISAQVEWPAHSNSSLATANR